MKRIKNDNFFMVYGWMVNELGLKGNELMIYAIIYGFTKKNGTEMNGGRDYLARWCNISVKTVQCVLDSLTEKGLVERIELYSKGAARYVNYKAILPDGVETTESACDDGKKLPSHEGKNVTPREEELDHSRGKKLPTYSISNNINKKNEEKDSLRSFGVFSFDNVILQAEKKGIPKSVAENFYELYRTQPPVLWKKELAVFAATAGQKGFLFKPSFSMDDINSIGTGDPLRSLSCYGQEASGRESLRNRQGS